VSHLQMTSVTHTSLACVALLAFCHTCHKKVTVACHSTVFAATPVARLLWPILPLGVYCCSSTDVIITVDSSRHLQISPCALAGQVINTTGVLGPGRQKG
jgi:hypothetical protein